MSTPHNTAPDGAFAKTVLMPGDPLRAKFIAENFLEDAKLVTSVRNIYGYTGTYKGKPVSVMAHGMGMPSASIYAYELFAFYGVENIIRIGSAGSYTADLDILDVVYAESAYSESSFAKKYDGFEGDTTYPSPELNEAIKAAAESLGKTCKPCRVHSSDVFYGTKTWQENAAESQAQCVEMESFAIFHLAKALGKRAACILTISDSFVNKKELSAEERQLSFRTMMEIALTTAANLD